MSIGALSPADTRFVLDTCRAIRKAGILENWKRQEVNVVDKDNPVYVINVGTKNIPRHAAMQVIGTRTVGGAAYAEVQSPKDPIGYGGPYLIAREAIATDSLGTGFNGRYTPAWCDYVGVSPGDMLTIGFDGILRKQMGGQWRFCGTTDAYYDGITAMVMAEAMSVGQYRFTLGESLSSRVARATLSFLDGTPVNDLYTGSALVVDVVDPENVFDTLGSSNTGYCDQIGSTFVAKQARCPD